MLKIEEDNFIEIIERHRMVICDVSRIFGVGEPDYIKDIEQDIVCSLFIEYQKKGAPIFENIISERLWVRQISLHVAINYVKQYRGKLPLNFVSDLDEVIEFTEEDVQTQEYLEELLEQLNDKEKRMMLYVLNQYSYAQIAAEEQMSETAVGTRMSRIYDKLRSIIKKR